MNAAAPQDTVEKALAAARARIVAEGLPFTQKSFDGLARAHALIDELVDRPPGDRQALNTVLVLLTFNPEILQDVSEVQGEYGPAVAAMAAEAAPYGGDDPAPAMIQIEMAMRIAVLEDSARNFEQAPDAMAARLILDNIAEDLTEMARMTNDDASIRLQAKLKETYEDFARALKPHAAAGNTPRPSP